MNDVDSTLEGLPYLGAAFNNGGNHVYSILLWRCSRQAPFFYSRTKLRTRPAGMPMTCIVFTMYRTELTNYLLTLGCARAEKVLNAAPIYVH